MMRGPKVYATAVRTPDGEIQVDVTENDLTKKWYNKVPLVRGCYSFVSSLVLGYKCLMHSAEISGELEEEEVQKSMGIISVVAGVLAVVLSLVLFMVLPTAVVGLIQKLIPLGNFATVVESFMKILIFLCYVLAVSQMKEIKRVFMYHGSEHKSIACYEAKMELTVENVRQFSRFHPRCGTSFLLITMIVSILVFMFVSWDNLLMRMLLKVVLLPVVVGITYEIIRFAGRYDNALTRIISAPGLWLQRLTVLEPEDDMIEVAIASIKAVIPGEEGSDLW
ncbi:MAG: DUF1385 domain-containing protein, partial [Oscillospiraceae bacterium]|nr:DUF1385 domain-containing protein [Oscillospiraceae bacterium]